jgi:hypothetical protein
MTKQSERGRYIRRIVYLEPRDVRAVMDYAREKGLRVRGFSPAVRMIIREWLDFRRGAVLVFRPGGPPGKDGPTDGSGACQ